MFSKGVLGGEPLGALAFNAGNFVEDFQGSVTTMLRLNATLAARLALGADSRVSASGQLEPTRRRQLESSTLATTQGSGFVTRRLLNIASTGVASSAVAVFQVRQTMAGRIATSFSVDPRLDYRYLNPTDRDRVLKINRGQRTIAVARDREKI